MNSLIIGALVTGLVASVDPATPPKVCEVYIFKVDEVGQALIDMDIAITGGNLTLAYEFSSIDYESCDVLYDRWLFRTKNDNEHVVFKATLIKGKGDSHDE